MSEARASSSGLRAAVGNLDEAIRAILAAPSAKTFVLDNLWICPMCAQVGGRFAPDKGWAGHAAEHLRRECPAIRSGQRAPSITPEQLSRLSVAQGIAYRLRTDPIWQCGDGAGRWYCPYCVEGVQTGGGAALATEDVGAITAHVQSCYLFDGGKGALKSAVQLREAVRQGNLRLDRAVQMLLQNSIAKVFSFDTFWICPMCNQVFKAITSAPGWSDQAARHLREECATIRTGQLVPRIPPEQLRKNVLAQAVPYVVQVNPLWQHVDRGGNWFCPFCLQVGAKLAIPGTVQPKDLRAVADHVIRCFYFDSGRGKAKDAAQLRDRVQESNAKLEAVHGFGPLLAKDPVWRVRDRNGCWVCPYCRRGVASVNFSPSRPEAAVDDVGVHLSKHCDAYRRKLPPAGDAAELIGSGVQPLAVARTVEEKREWVQVDKRVYEMLVRIAQESARARGPSPDSLEKTIQAAQKRQLRMLPKPPRIDGYEVDVLFKPSDRLSGDFYDFLQIDADHWGFLIGDVSGHGVDAALVMAMVKKVISLAGKSRPMPKDVLAYANELIRPDLEKGTFVTACYGLLDTRERIVRFARAGHNPLLIYNPARGEMPIALRPDGMALGVADSARLEAGLEEMEVALRPGDYVLLYTDGMVEQDNAAGEMLHLEGFMEIIRRAAGGDGAALLARIEQALAQYRGDKPQEDDVTIVCFRVL